MGDAQQICLAAIRRLLEDEFTIVGAARDGSALLQTAVESRPDVIVTDVLDRFLDGGDAVRQIRALCPDSKVVILTDRRDAWQAHQSLQAGGSAYILKQDAPADLFAAIRAAANGESGIVSVLLAQAAAPEMQKMGILTPRQQQVLRLLSEGRTQKEIASILDVSSRTVEFHKYELMRRLAVRSSAELMAVAARHGLIDVAESGARLALNW